MKLGLQLHILLETIRAFHKEAKNNGMSDNDVIQTLKDVAELDTFDRKMKLFYSFKFMQQPINDLLDQCGVVKMGV